MRSDIQELLQKQSVWQRARRKNSWSRKLKESAAMRRTLAALKKRPVTGRDIED